MISTEGVTAQELGRYPFPFPFSVSGPGLDPMTPLARHLLAGGAAYPLPPVPRPPATPPCPPLYPHQTRIKEEVTEA